MIALPLPTSPARRATTPDGPVLDTVQGVSRPGWLGRIAGRVSRAIAPRRSHDGKLQAIEASPAFAGCDAEDLVQLGACTEWVDVEAGDVIAHRTDPSGWWWLVLDGSIVVRRCDAPSELVGPGHAAGLDPRCPDGPETVTVVAGQQSTLLVASRRSLLGTCAGNPRLTAAVLRSVGRATDCREADRVELG